jgi:peptidoglycan/xylan/chitin deacetylase (PgdA/CDA1 family)
VLEALDHAGVKATFFVIGTLAERFPKLVVATESRGHEIGAHCFEHRSHHELTATEIDDDIRRLLDLLDRIGVKPPRMWRPPYGHARVPDTYDVARRHGLHVLTWTVETRDWAREPAAKIMAEITKGSIDRGMLDENSIVLMHDSVPQTASLVPVLAAEIRRRRWTFAQPTPATHTPEVPPGVINEDPRYRDWRELRFGWLRHSVGRMLARAMRRGVEPV